ncbi:MAG: hypothetical protein ABMA14_00605 [Hyphomonadaceae bacterium]
MADGNWHRFFLTPTGEAAKAWRPPLLLRGRRKRRLLLLVVLGLAQSVLSVVIALSVREVVCAPLILHFRAHHGYDADGERPAQDADPRFVTRADTRHPSPANA